MKMKKLKRFLIKCIPFKKYRHQIEIRQNIFGKNNSWEGTFPKRIKCQIYGNNNKIIFGDNLQNFHAHISIGTEDCPVNNCVLKIGDDSTAGNVNIMLLEDNSYVHIGKDCMFSIGVSIWCSDTHSLIDSDKQILNIGKLVEIGNHVWVGMDVKIGKNTKISDNSVVGWGSIVTKKFNQTNVVIAGNPAKIVKENINWDRRRPQQILNEKTKKQNKKSSA